MRGSFVVVVLAVLMLTTTGWAVDLWEVKSHPTTLADWFDVPGREWTREHYSWFQYIDRRGSSGPITGEQGTFGIGNSYAYTMVGLSYPINAMHGTTAYRYRKPGRFYGDTGVVLFQNGTEFTIEEEWLWHTRRASCVVTKSRAADLELYTVDFAPIGLRGIVRVVIAKNVSDQVQQDVEMGVNLLGTDVTVAGNALRQQRGNRFMEVGYLSGPAYFDSDYLKTSLGDLAPGQEVVRVIYMAGAMADSDVTTFKTSATATGVDGMLQEVFTVWNTWFDSLASLQTPDPKVNDYWEIQMLTLRTQQCYEGGVRPMSRYTSIYFRDDASAVALYQRAGFYEGMRATIDYYYKAAAQNNALSNSIGFADDLPDVTGPVDWANMPVMPGSNRHPAEAPSWLPIKAMQYYESTGNLPWLRDRWEFIKRTVEGQEWTDDYLQELSGDEPWRWTFFASFLLFEPENFMWSAYSQFLLVRAAEDCERMALALGETADAAFFRDLADNVRNLLETEYWQPGGFYAPGILFEGREPLDRPYEDINTMPLYLDYLPADHPRMHQNVQAMIDLLLRDDGTIQSEAILEFYDGMVPGQWLQNLAVLDHPEGENAFNALNLILQDTGETAEGQFAGTHNVATFIYDPTSEREDVTARFRPWEGGINGEGFMAYLTGQRTDFTMGHIQFQPRLPNDWTWTRFENARYGDLRYDFSHTLDNAEGTERSYALSGLNAPTAHPDVNVTLIDSWDSSTYELDRIEVPTGQTYDASQVRTRQYEGRTILTIPDVPWRFGSQGESELRVKVYLKDAVATPTPTPEPTMTQVPVPRVLLAGYTSTDVDAINGGTIALAAYTILPLAEPLEWSFAGSPTGFTLTPDADGTGHILTFPVFGGIPAGQYPTGLLLEGRSGTAAAWPFLRVEP